jgi:hypothetical protein
LLECDHSLALRTRLAGLTKFVIAFCKVAKAENHANNVAPHFTHCNYHWIHQTTRVTPAMQAGLADHVWEIEDLLKLID